MNKSLETKKELKTILLVFDLKSGNLRPSCAITLNLELPFPNPARILRQPRGLYKSGQSLSLSKQLFFVSKRQKAESHT